jgi:hypothetical protein
MPGAQRSGASFRGSTLVSGSSTQAGTLIESGLITTQRGVHMPWTMSREAEERAEVLTVNGPMRSLELDNLTDPLMPGPWYIGESLLREHFSDAIADLRLLAEEASFEVTLGCMLNVDYEVAVRDGQFDLPAQTGLDISAIGMPVEALALMAPYVRQPSSPRQLVANPHVAIAGNRALSQWLTGQPLDSAIFRSLAILDRIATLVWTAASQPIPSRAGRDHFPGFTHGWLSDLGHHYSGSEWTALVALTQDPVLTLANRVRDQFTHSRRLRSELHGDMLTVYEGSGGEVLKAATSAADHEAIALAIFDAGVRVAVDRCRELFGKAEPPRKT